MEMMIWFCLFMIIYPISFYLFFFFLLFASTHTPWIYLVLAFGLGRRE